MPGHEKMHRKEKKSQDLVENGESRSAKKKRKRREKEVERCDNDIICKKIKLEIKEEPDSDHDAHNNPETSSTLETSKISPRRKKKRKKSKNADKHPSIIGQSIKSEHNPEPDSIFKDVNIGLVEVKHEDNAETTLSSRKKKTKKEKSELLIPDSEAQAKKRHKKKRKKDKKRIKIENEERDEDAMKTKTRKENPTEYEESNRMKQDKEKNAEEARSNFLEDNEIKRKRKKKKKKRELKEQDNVKTEETEKQAVEIKKKEVAQPEKIVEIVKEPEAEMKQLWENAVLCTSQMEVESSSNEDNDVKVGQNLNLDFSSESSGDEKDNVSEVVIKSSQKRNQVNKAKNEPPKSHESQVKQEAKRTPSKRRSKLESQDVKSTLVAKGDWGSKKQIPKQTSTKKYKLSPSDSSKHELLLKWRLSANELELLKKQGVTWEKGRWSNEEIKILESNIEKAVASTGVTYEEFFDRLLRKNGKERDVRFKGVYRIFVEGINRPLKVVFEKVMRTYDPCNYKGVWTPKEEKELLGYYTKYGNQWAKIGEKMGRSKFSIAHKIRRLVNISSNGDLTEIPPTIMYRKWKPEEVSLLKEAISKLLLDKKEDPAEEVAFNWEAIALQVKTRSSESCRVKWFYDLSLREESSGKKMEWNRRNTGLVLTELINSGVTVEKKVDWDKIVEKLQLPTAGRFVKLRWKGIKEKTPNYKGMNFIELLNLLKKKYP